MIHNYYYYITLSKICIQILPKGPKRAFKNVQGQFSVIYLLRKDIVKFIENPQLRN